MDLIIIGSGGNVPTPRISCLCETCNNARKKGEPYKRCLAALYIKDINTVIDCPEDISESLNRRNVTEVENIFLTHWHPDHSFGFRLLVQANYDFINDKCLKKINIYMPSKVYLKFKKIYPAIEYLLKNKKMGNLILINDGDKIKINNILIEPKAYTKNSEHYAYLISEDNKKVLYAPCDTINLKGKYENLTLLIHEQGYFSSEIKWELSFDKLIDRIKSWKPKSVILTHISEDEIRRWGWEYLNKKETENKNLNLKFAYDGMKIRI